MVLLSTPTASRATQYPAHSINEVLEFRACFLLFRLSKKNNEAFMKGRGAAISQGGGGAGDGAEINQSNSLFTSWH